MIRKKVCMLGSFAVGKTSLVARYVRGIFSEKYLTTIGVKIDKKQVSTPSGQIQLMLWDLSGDDDYQNLRTSYLKGSSGFVLVIDGTRPATHDVAQKILQKIDSEYGQVPLIVFFNKADLQDEWLHQPDWDKPYRDRGAHICYTSAKTGDGVEEAFQQLALSMTR